MMALLPVEGLILRADLRSRWPPSADRAAECPSGRLMACHLLQPHNRLNEPTLRQQRLALQPLAAEALQHLRLMLLVATGDQDQELLRPHLDLPRRLALQGRVRRRLPRRPQVVGVGRGQL